MTKNLFVFLLVAMALNGCSLDDDSTPVAYGYAAITEVDLPDSFEFGETYDIDITYSLNSDCFIFSGFDMIRGEPNSRTVRAVVEAFGSNDCDDSLALPVEFTETLGFEVIFTEDYTFRFLTGIDEEGNETFLEYVVPVE